MNDGLIREGVRLEESEGGVCKRRVVVYDRVMGMYAYACVSDRPSISIHLSIHPSVRLSFSYLPNVPVSPIDNASNDRAAGTVGVWICADVPIAPPIPCPCAEPPIPCLLRERGSGK